MHDGLCTLMLVLSSHLLRYRLANCLENDRASVCGLMACCATCSSPISVELSVHKRAKDRGRP